MHYALLRLFFGADAFLENVCLLLKLRKQAQAKHEDNRELRAKLTTGNHELAALTSEYASVKEKVEAGYALELD